MSLVGRLKRGMLLPCLEVVSKRFAQTWDILRQSEQTQWWSTKEIHDLQTECLEAIGRSAFKTPFYEKRFRSVGITTKDQLTAENLARLPRLTKQDIRDQKNELINPTWAPEDLLAVHSGGSTGFPTTVFRSAYAIYSDEAMCFRHNRWAGCNYSERYAELWGAERALLEKAAGVKQRILNFVLGPRLFLNAFRMNRKEMDHFIDKLNRFRPAAIIAYASSAFFLAQYVQSSGKRLNARPAGIITSADTLHSDHRQTIEEVFGCPVYNRYGSRETGIMASECSEKTGLHLCAETKILEVVRPDLTPCEPGETGEILVTSLVEHGMPLIRYAIGDIGVAGDYGECRCGRGLPRILEVRGRTADVFRFPKGTMVHGEFFTHLFYGAKGLEKFQVIKDAVDHLAVKLVARKDFDKGVIERFIAEVDEFIEPGIKVDFSFVEEIEPTRLGKHRFTISKVATSL